MAETLTHSELASEAKARVDELTEQFDSRRATEPGFMSHPDAYELNGEMRAASQEQHAEEWRQAHDEGKVEYPQGKLEYRTGPDTRAQDYLAAGANNLMALEKPLTKEQQEELDATLWRHEQARNQGDEPRAA